MTHTSAHNSGPSPRDGERSLQPHSADAADVFFREAGLTPAAITRLTEKKQGSAIAEIIVSGKLSRSAARELSEAIKRDEAPLSLESAKLLAQICSVELSARRPDESLHDQRKREELAFDHVVKLIVRTYEKELAEDAGKDNPRTRLLSRLDNKALQDLFACVSRGPGHAEIALKVLRDVSVTSPTGEGQALSILNTHRGDWMILDRVLTTVADTHDILLASKRVQVLFASEDMRREYAAQQRGQLGNEREDYSREEPSMRESIALASGVVSTSNDLYCFMNIGKPDQSVFLGNFATPHLAETLFSGKYQGKTIERRKEERQRRSKALFEDVTLGDLLEDPKLVQEIGSPLIGRALQVYKDLISEQQRLRQEILSEIQNISPKETLEFLATMQLRADDPKYLIGRARTAIQENPESVSEIVRTAFNNLQSPYTELGIDASNPA